MRGKTVIAGIGHTAFGKLPGRSAVSLNVEACRKALEDEARQYVRSEMAYWRDVIRRAKLEITD